MAQRLDDRRHSLLSSAAWRAEAELKSELSVARRGEHKSDRRHNLACWIAVVILVFAIVFAVVAPLGPLSGVLTVVLILVGVPLLIWGAQ